ncbi:hypothetical protein DPX16_15527 [Anabarilius grahami]|uniref:MADF domain-containing protein n=1 Tax=Anabarilius grahami TaxID=495550 RepID=A0A3N0XCI8_ANAGA|nr:hypothetical protein DPX16_15527 [Anabarilius grahami]
MAKRKRDDGAARWNYEMEEKFVELWQQYSCLYDVSSRDYHDRLKKEKCWRTIAEALQQPGPCDHLGNPYVLVPSEQRGPWCSAATLYLLCNNRTEDSI